VYPLCDRWCRTYFLQRGRAAATVDVSDDLLIGDEDDETAADHKASEPILSKGALTVDPGVAKSLLRLEGLYVKLVLSLRLVVKYAFAKHSDVLEAGTDVQVHAHLR
jgi:hypothetical protein